MKSTVETLSPTRVRLAVEVPFDEIRPSLDRAYKSIAKQVRVPGFRPGKVPARIIDQRVGRQAVLDEAVQDAVPRAYAEAVRDNNVRTLGQPDFELTKLEDGTSLAFTAEVDVRPQLSLPELVSLNVTVDDVVVTDADVDEQLDGLRERFAVLKAADRPVHSGDYVSIDLLTTVDGAEVPGGSTTGMSYEVGSGGLLPGLDEALVGLSAGEQTSFQTELVGGELAGWTAEVSATVRSVKEKELPQLDDEFAQTASEFDTLDELRADLRARLERVKALEQGVQARDKVLEALLGTVEVPLPESVVRSEVELRQHDIGHQLESAGLTIEDYLAAEQRAREEFDAEIKTNSETAVRTQLVLDAVAEQEQLGVSDIELTEHVVAQAQRYGVSPQEFADRMTQAGNLPALVADVRRNKALAHVMEHATVTDASGRPVDIAALRRVGGEYGDTAVEEDEARDAAGDRPEEAAAGAEPAAGAATSTAAGASGAERAAGAATSTAAGASGAELSAPRGPAGQG